MIRPFLLVAATAALLPAQDDRDRTTPTAAIWMHDQTPADLQALTGAGWRFTDLEIESTSPWEFTVSAVQNTGGYAKGWLWVYGVTGAQLATTISQNNARIVDLEPYDDNGTTRFAAILVGNTGADAKAWWWNYGMTNAQLDAMVSSNNARLVCFERYTIGGQTRYAAAMISNTGADARAWGYLYGVTAAAIAQNIAQYGNRVYGIERVGTDSYDVILLHNAGMGWWYYFDLTSAQLTEVLQQNLGRLVDVERHATLTGTRFTAVLLDNANTLERTARAAFASAAPGALGKYGFFLKEVNGPVLAQMRPDTVFEPASTIKTLYHVHAMRRVSLGLASLNQLVNKPISCGVAGQNQTLELTLAEMMEYSDNWSTLAISNTFGIPGMNTTAAALGMGDTSINSIIGCTWPLPENELTLRDLSDLHEAVANGYLGGQRAKFYELMAESLSFPSWGTEDLDDRIDAQAVTFGLPPAVVAAFKQQLHIAFKPGSMSWTTNGVTDYSTAEGGWMSVPFKSGAGVLQPREYTFGVFNHDFHTQQMSGHHAMCDAELELVWFYVRAALATWNNYVPGQITSLPGAGCVGSNGTPMHTAVGTPDAGETVYYRVGNVPPSTLAVALYGLGDAQWLGIPLPVDFAPLGAPGCLLRVDYVQWDARVATTIGTATSTFVFPPVPAYIGQSLYTQYLVLDPAANTFGWTFSNALRSTMGGWL